MKDETNVTNHSRLEKSLSDGDLLELYKNGNARALSVLFERHYSGIKDKVFFYVKDPQATMDITQDVFTSAFQSINKGRHPHVFISWLLVVARNVSIDYLRRTKKRQLVQSTDDRDIFEKFGGVSPAIEGQMIKSEISFILGRLIDTLPKKRRDYIILKFYKNMSYGKISRIANVKLTVPAEAGFKAYATLRKAIQENHLDLRYA